MPISFTCPSCEQSFTLPDAAGGRLGRCKGCKRKIRVPFPLVVEDGEPRAHHYVFAHRFLPAVSFGNPEGAGLLIAMAGQESGELFRRCWADVASELPPAERLTPDGFKGAVVEVSDRLAIAVVTLPQARFQAEAVFVAGSYQRKRAGMTFRLFALELSRDLQAGQPSVVLGEWQPGRRGLAHVNWGGDVPNSPEGFAQAIAHLIRDPKRKPLAVSRT
ncbi:MAG: hypothetical protein R3F62_22955 [Planctomycetota bacterium]